MRLIGELKEDASRKQIEEAIDAELKIVIYFSNVFLQFILLF